MDLVDDLLEIASEDRFEKARDPPIEPDTVENSLVGRPLHHPHQRVAFPAGHDIVEQIAVPEAAPMLHALGMDLVRGRGDFVDLAALEQTTDDRAGPSRQ